MINNITKNKYAMVFMFASLGGIIRYLIISNTQSDFPFGTLFVNCVGAFFITVINIKYDGILKVALTTGLLGGLTTFSTFIKEFTFMLSNNVILAFTYVAVTLIFGLLFVKLGSAYCTRGA